MPNEQPTKHIARRLLFYEVAGFAVIISLSWMDELLDLPSVLFGGSPGHNWHEAALETVIILATAIPTILLSRRLVRRVVYLDKFLRVCGWCGKIAVEDKWGSMASYFRHELKTKTTHGMRPECYSKIEIDLSRQAGESGQP